jgi:2-C-methyl-D-erythritol 4-phosphate cytidylyltransferase
MSKEIPSNHKPAALSVIIAAAGSASRLGLNESKQFLKVNGKPLLYYSLEKFIQLDNLKEIVIVTNDTEETNILISSFKNKSTVEIKSVPGGELRQESVQNGFKALSKNTDLVLIHDVGRPLFEINDVKKCISSALKSGAAILCVPVVDTIKKGLSDKDELYIEKTINRDSLYQIQTPQIFSYNLLKNVYEKSNLSNSVATDEAKLVELMGKPVNLVIGSRKNIKITYKEDLEIVEGLLAKEGQNVRSF